MEKTRLLAKPKQNKNVIPCIALAVLGHECMDAFSFQILHWRFWAMDYRMHFHLSFKINFKMEMGLILK